MSSKITVNVPEELKHPLFFPTGEITWEKSDESCLNVRVPFIYEAAFFTGNPGLKPWENYKQSIPALLNEWEKIKEPLQEYFAKRRKKEAAVLMKTATAYFLEFLFWTNGKPVKLFPRISYEELEFVPVNIEERLEFIIARQNLYHSSVQLVELFHEMKKLYAKLTVINPKYPRSR